MELKDWQDLLFPDGQSPLDDSIESSSMSEEKEDDAFQNYVFRTRFSSRQEQSTHSAHRIDRKTAEFFADELAVSIENEWLGSQVKDFSLKVLRLNLTIHDMKIISLEFPKIRFEVTLAKCADEIDLETLSKYDQLDCIRRTFNNKRQIYISLSNN